MGAKRSVVVAASVSAALLASIGAFAVGNGFIGDRPADRVGSFEPTAELRLVPAVSDSKDEPPSEVTATTERPHDESPATTGAQNHATPAAPAQSSSPGGGTGEHPPGDGPAVQPPPPATAAPPSPTTARLNDGKDSSGADHGGIDGDGGSTGDD